LQRGDLDDEFCDITHQQSVGFLKPIYFDSRFGDEAIAFGPCFEVLSGAYLAIMEFGYIAAFA
jgi:hypothetical protein